MFQKALSHRTRVKFVMGMSLRNVTSSFLAHEMWDVAIEEEMPVLLADLAMVSAFNTCQLWSSHSGP